MEQPPILPDREMGETALSYGRRVHMMLLETPTILPDHHADAALDGWEPFESRRVRAELNRWDIVGAVVAVLGAVVAVWLT